MNAPNHDLLRILDANFNRASEGLRVVEEFARFVLADRFLAESLKTLRHDLAAAFQAIPCQSLLAARDTLHDVGTSVVTPSEYARETIADLVRANLQRAAQALRSIEEFGKTFDPTFAAAVEQLRYRTYTLEKSLVRVGQAQERLAHARLYVLIDGRESVEGFCRLVEELVAAEVDVIQLRDKRLTDRELVSRARELRRRTLGTGTLFVVNDRPDFAVLAEADGVHVGQDELTVAEVRKIVGPERLVGVSTHNLAQARHAVLDGADYLGCGPTFPSSTKSFDAFAGLPFLREVAAEISLPAFAIGGITLENLGDVIAAGVRRVAVSGAVVQRSDLRQAAAEFRCRLASVASE